MTGPSTINIFTPAGHQDVLALVTMFAVLLFTARLFGELAMRFRQPAIIGELAAGIILGPSVLGHFFPIINGYIIPATATQGHLFEAMSLIGAMFLLLVTGLETDIDLIRRHAKTALSVSLCGITVTFTVGYLFAQMVPDYLLTDPNQRIVFSLFIATALSISAIPVIAKVLFDLKLTRRDIGQTIIASGMSDDTIGWIILSIVTGLIGGQAVSAGNIFMSIGKVLFFFLLSITVGRVIVKRALDFVQDNGTSPDRLLTLVVVCTFAWGSFAQFLHLEPVLGAFVIGIIFSNIPRLPRRIRGQLESITFGIFAPIFFAVAGLKVNIIQLFADPMLLKITIFMILFACVGKFTGTFIGAKFIAKQDTFTSLSFGAALNARGVMGIIIATIGLSLGILNQEIFSIVVLMSVVTSLIAPFLLRIILKKVRPSEEEKTRIEKEKLAAESPIQSMHRVLIPLRKRSFSSKLNNIQIIKSLLLQKMSQKVKLSITLLSVDVGQHKEANLEFLNHVKKLFPEQEVVIKFVEGTDSAKVILEEAQKDYDLIIIGAPQQRSNEQYLFSNIIDTVVKFAPCATLVVHAKDLPLDWKPKHTLVPTNGSLASKHAAELSFLFASEPEQTVHVLHVLEEIKQNYIIDDYRNPLKSHVEIAEKLVKDMEKLGELNHVKVIGEVNAAVDAAKSILNNTQKNEIDLIILGTDIRPASTRLFLGPNVELILQKATCPVLILNTI